MSIPGSPSPFSFDLLPYLQLHLAKDIGSILASRLLLHFGSPEAVLAAPAKLLEEVEQIGPRKAAAIRSAGDPSAARKQLRLAAERGIRILCFHDDAYPSPLRYIPDPPLCLFVRGTWQPEDAVAIAIVGTRRCSHYGREQARRFGWALGGSGFTVVSGLARGVDAAAHRAAMDAGGRTVAILGGGVDAVYPPEHESLATEISDSGGAVISEYPLQLPPVAGNFPRRNRLIAGLSLGVLVIEAGRRSGACITARLAQEYNREVFAVPGRIDQPSTTAGVNRMIRDGQAKLVTSLDDVLAELDEVGAIMSDSPIRRECTLSRNVSSLTSEEQRVLGAIRAGHRSSPAISRESELAMSKVNAGIVSLQLKGWITRLPGDEYVVRVSADGKP
ncbi:MAG: DNA-processing protein DprA [Phycisphaerae bacterium]